MSEPAASAVITWTTSVSVASAVGECSPESLHRVDDENERLGGLNFAECIIYSLNFNDVQRHGWDNWDETFRLVSDACQRLKAAGAEAIVLCANTAHAIVIKRRSSVSRIAGG